MEFCPKCGSRLEAKKGKTGTEKTLVLTCAKCGYKKPAATRKSNPKSPRFSSTSQHSSWQ